MNESIYPSAVSTPRFRGEILRQIYRIWLFRRLVPVLAAEVVIIALVLYGLGRMVFVQRVAENALSVFFRDPSAIFQFGLAAFVNAPVLTKLFILGFLVIAALIVRGITQGILRLILVRQNYFSRIAQ